MDDDKTPARFWKGWLRPGDEARFQRDEKLQALHQQAQREASELRAMEDVNGATRNGSSKDPFIAFKQFIDRRIDDITSIPQTMAANLRISQAYHEQHKAWNGRMYAKWTGRPGSEADDARTIAQRRWNGVGPREAEEAARILLRESTQHNAHVPREKIDRLYRDDENSILGHQGPSLSPGGACYYKSEDHDNLPSTAFGFTSNPWEPRWLSVDWFKRSIYSPIALEMDDKLSQYDTKWRHAFEDLMAAALDKPMTSQEKFGVRTSPLGRTQSAWRGPGLDWMLSLHCRGILPPRAPYTMVANDISNIGPLHRNLSSALQEYHALVRELEMPPCDVAFQEILPNGKPLAKPQQPLSPRQERALDLLYLRQERFTGRLQDAGEEPEDTAWLEDHITQLKAREEQSSASRLGDPKPRAEQGSDDDLTPESELDMYDYDAQASSKCPDAIGRAIGEAARQEKEEALAEQKGKCPDELGREIGEAAKDAGLAELLDLLGLSPTVKSGCTRHDFEDEDVFDDDEEDDDEDEFAEDLPGELWSQARVQHEQQVVQQQTDSQARQQRDAGVQTERPQVLSSLTTTQTTRAADGTVTTRVVLKRSFADGSEESNESVQTTHESSEAAKEVQETSKQVEVKDAEEKAKKNKGWFWS